MTTSPHGSAKFSSSRRRISGVSWRKTAPVGTGERALQAVFDFAKRLWFWKWQCNLSKVCLEVLMWSIVFDRLFHHWPPNVIWTTGDCPMKITSALSPGRRIASACAQVKDGSWKIVWIGTWIFFRPVLTATVTPNQLEPVDLSIKIYMTRFQQDFQRFSVETSVPVATARWFMTI